MNNKKIVVALGHNALGSTFPEQKAAVKKAAAAIADLIEAKYQVVITHSNGDIKPADREDDDQSCQPVSPSVRFCHRRESS